jgi:HAD superfamily hydrolase (TIGR01509 family)
MHSRAPIEAMIFDIGRVIVRVEPRRALLALAPGATPPALPQAAAQGAAAAQAEKLWRAIQADPRWHDWQEGRITPRAWHAHLSQQFALRLSFEDFSRAWNSVIAPQPILPDRVFAELARQHPRLTREGSGRGVRLVLLSNTDPLHVAHLRRNFSFQRYFDAEVYSCEAHASKPSWVIFRAALRAAQARAGRTLFIDDSPSYVRAAQRFGLQALQFRSRAQLEAELRRRKLLSP